MAGIGTIRRGIGLGPLATITRGYLGGKYLPGIALLVQASPSIALAVAAGSVLLVQAQTSTAMVVAQGGTLTVPGEN